VPKRILQPIVLEEKDAFAQVAMPREFTWRGRRYLIESLSCEWRRLGRWWKGEPERRYLRAVTPEGIAFDICQDMKTGKWVLVGMED